jgi:hypothetical protein
VIEERLAEKFRAATADEPGLGFDPDDVVDRAIARGRRRATVLGASAAAGVVMLGAVTVLHVVRVGYDAAGGAVVAPTTKPTQPCDPGAVAMTKAKVLESIKAGPGTKPTGPAKTKQEAIESGKSAARTKPSGPPRSTTPSYPCALRTELLPFTGWEQVVEQLRPVASVVLAQRMPGVGFDLLGWKPAIDRCLFGVFEVTPARTTTVTLVVCHDQKAGSELPDGLGGDWGAAVSDTANPDGSHLRIYHNDQGVAARHVRTDGVVVQVQTGTKAPGQTGSTLSAEQLAAVAMDGRLTF